VLSLRVVQARFGDCLILEFGSASSPRYLLIDGGPPGNYARHLKPELTHIAEAGGALELAILSHVDNDHVVGLLDLLSELREQRVNRGPETVTIGALWDNSFEQSVDRASALAPRLRSLLARGAQAMEQTGIAVAGIAEGAQLRLAAQALELPLNEHFPSGLVCLDDAPPQLRFDNLTLRVVGPTKASLDNLREEWERWLDAHEDAVASGDPAVAAMADRSIPNLSSIMLLAEADQKRVLLTGDGRGDHLLSGLEQAGLLDAQGTMHVDVLKVAHHGSDRNATRAFFGSVSADTYVISADGTYGNPDLATLIWIVEAAGERGREIELVLTNQPPSVAKLLAEYPPNEYGYTATLLPQEQHSQLVRISPS
jgi:hypothetical protein